MVAAFVHRLRVRYGECDAQGVVFNPHYYAYFDHALTELWREAIGPYAAMVDQGVDLVVAASGARYLAPAGFDDLLDIELRPTHLGRSSLVTAARVLRGHELLVEGEMRHVFVDAVSRRPTPMPPDVRAGLARYAESAVAPSPAVS